MARRLLPSALLLLACLVVPGTAVADGSAAQNAARAEAEFQEGRRLMEAKRYAEACARFRESYELAPAGGTLLNLADCYEKNGQLANAAARFQESIVLAQKAGRPDREKVARERLERLDPRLSKLTIILDRRTRLGGAEVKLDGRVLEAADVGGPVAVDPGPHTVEVRAPGKKPFTTSIDVAERARTTVDVPPLADEEPEETPVLPEKRPEREEVAPEDRGSTQRTLGIVAAISGGVALGAGIYFGVSTQSKWSEAKGRCVGPEGGLECDALGVELAGEARRSGNLATIAFIASGALVAGGAVLYFTAPSGASKRESAKARTFRAGVGPGSVVVGGTF